MLALFTSSLHESVSAPDGRPLDGVTVLDLTQIMSGPFATMLLADLGALVIKVEPPAGDPTRGYPPHFIAGDSAYFHSLNRNKKSVTLDLQTDSGKRTLLALVARADVVVDNFRPSALARLGCDYDSLRAAKANIICCSITGYGLTSERRDNPAYDLGIQAESGAMSLTGAPGGPPLRMGIPMGDLAAAMYAALAITAALIHRSRTGEGQRIDIGMLPSLASLLTYQLNYYLSSKVAPEPLGTGHTSIVPFRAFRAKDGYVCVMAPSEKFWTALCRVVDAGLAKDPRYATQAGRLAAREALDAELEQAFAKRPVRDWVERLEAEGIPVAPVSTLAEALAEPEIAELIRHTTRDGVDIPVIASPIRMSASPLFTYAPPPRLGEHNDMVSSDGELNDRTARRRQRQVVHPRVDAAKVVIP